MYASTFPEIKLVDCSLSVSGAFTADPGWSIRAPTEASERFKPLTGADFHNKLLLWCWPCRCCDSTSFWLDRQIKSTVNSSPEEERTSVACPCTEQTVISPSLPAVQESGPGHSSSVMALVNGCKPALRKTKQHKWEIKLDWHDFSQKSKPNYSFKTV